MSLTWGILPPAARAQNSSGNITSVQVANNTTAIVIKGAAGLLVGLEAFSIDTTTTWVKLYDSATAVTCGAGTPKARYFIVGNTNGSGFITSGIPADLYTRGIVVCFTTGFADSDTTAPTASKFVVNFHWQ